MIRKETIATFVLVLLSLVPRLGSADTRRIDVPKGVGPLPDISSGGVLVDKDDLRLYRALLPEPLADLTAQGEFAFSAVKSPQLVERFSDPFPGSEQSYHVSDVGELSPLPLRPRGILFSRDESDAEGRTSGLRDRAYKTMWNASAALWRYGYAKADISLVIFKESLTSGRQVRWRIERMYPAALGTYPGTLSPLFREKISAVLPAVLEGMQWLTIRSLGKTDDYVWAASPITGNVRQMTASNRADELFTGAFSPDDLFVWSGKVELVQPRRVTSQVLLVPFVTRSFTRSGGDTVCENRALQMGPLVELNHATRRFVQARGWVPTNVIMAPRQVTQIDFSSSDPLAPDVSTSLFIDDESQVPVYKIVWGRDGRVRSFVIGFVGDISANSGFQPFSVAQIIVRPQTGERSVVMLDTLTTCSALPSATSYADFDPAGLGSRSALENATPTPPAVGASPHEDEPND